MGDVLWTEPVIRALSNSYSKIIVYTKFDWVFAGYPLQNVEFRSDLPLYIKAWLKIEKLFGVNWLGLNLDMAYERDPKKHILQAYSEKAGISYQPQYPWLTWMVTEQKASDKPYVVVHLSASSATKNFRTVHGVDWEKFTASIQQKGYKIIEIGDPPGILPEYFRKTSFSELVNLISGASVFVGIDSAPSHIAASLKIPSLLFFGAVNPAYRHVTSLFKGIIMQNPCEFAGCYHDNPLAYENHECRLVGDAGQPKCCTFSTDLVLANFEKIELNYLQKNVDEVHK